ncbi:hypothetical protein CVT26_008700 [Gymnopilus dilepis]|uniref:MARVEL domain-containing protein n=1 Tax=Gymnopilus dilepis TaxID=231916 RepID=A0A409W9K4_9AGAR|nr:hypothetical protein CVT26_008700 [Gymnopilus dilepis]
MANAAVSPAGPLKTTRLLTLGLAFCFAVISGSLGLNALIKSNQQKTQLKKLGAPATVDIDTHDIFDSGVVATVASAVIAILVFLFLLGTYLPFTRSLTGRTLRLQAVSLSLAWLMLFGSMIAYMIFFVNRQAGVKAFIGNIQLPDSAVQAVEKMTGQTGVYRHIHYLELFAILPWFCLLFTLIAIGTLFAAASRRTRTAAEVPASPTTNRTSVGQSMTEKDNGSHHEKSSV